jgi:hypothetical protein
MATAASKRPGAAGEVLNPPATFSHALHRLPTAETGRWRLCAGKGCRKAGRCRGGADQCPENMDVTVIWLREARRAGCASPTGTCWRCWAARSRAPPRRANEILASPGAAMIRAGCLTS